MEHAQPAGTLRAIEDIPQVARANCRTLRRKTKTAANRAYWGTGVTVTWGSPKPLLEVRFLGPPLLRRRLDLKRCGPGGEGGRHRRVLDVKRECERGDARQGADDRGDRSRCQPAGGRCAPGAGFSMSALERRRRAIRSTARPLEPVRRRPSMSLRGIAIERCRQPLRAGSVFWDDLVKRPA